MASSLSGELRKIKQKPVSINGALTYIQKKEKRKLSEIAGTWKMSDKEAEEFLGSLRKGWARWKIKSV